MKKKFGKLTLTGRTKIKQFKKQNVLFMKPNANVATQNIFSNTI